MSPSDRMGEIVTDWLADRIDVTWDKADYLLLGSLVTLDHREADARLRRLVSSDEFKRIAREYLWEVALSFDVTGSRVPNGPCVRGVATGVRLSVS